MNVAPVVLSLKVALPAVAAATAVGVLGAELASRGGRRLAVALDVLVTAPLVFPPTVLGYYLLVLLGHGSALGRAWEAVFGAPLVFGFWGAVVAAFVTSLPLVLQAARAALDDVDPRLVQVARTLGATPWQAFWRVKLPLATRGLVGGALVGFARALGDFGVTLMVAGNVPGQTQTAALAIYDALQAGKDDEALALVAVMTAASLTVVLAASALGRRGHAR